MILNTEEIKAIDPSQEKKDFQVDLNPEVIPDPDILNHQKIIIKDNNPEIEALITRNHINLHTITETTADHAAILTPEVPAEVDQIRSAEKDQIHLTEIGHLQCTNKTTLLQKIKTVDTENKCI